MYIRWSACLLLFEFSTSPSICNMGLYAFSYPIYLSRGIFVFDFIIIIKSVVWVIIHCLWLDNETMICTEYLAMFFWVLTETRLWAEVIDFQLCHFQNGRLVPNPNLSSTTPVRPYWICEFPDPNFSLTLNIKSKPQCTSLVCMERTL